jgi:hypothetical protein
VPGVAAPKAAAAPGGLPTPRRLGPTLGAPPCAGAAPNTSCCTGSCACRLPAGDMFCARLPCAEGGCDRLPCVDRACARLPCWLTFPPCCAACDSQPDPLRSLSAMPCTWCHPINRAVQKQTWGLNITVQTFVAGTPPCKTGWGVPACPTCPRPAPPACCASAGSPCPVAGSSQHRCPGTRSPAGWQETDRIRKCDAESIQKHSTYSKHKESLIVQS